jgi:LacI family transcriptional regulator
VGPDNRIGAYEAVRHLVRHGHRRIAHIQGPLQYQCSHDRFAGYQQALEEAGIAVDPALVVQGDFTIASGRAAATELLALPDRPSAVFAANDQMAYGLLSVGESRSFHVPGDLAVIGFDDTALSAHTRPALSTVRQPFAEMGRSAAEMLLAMVSAPRMFGGAAYSQGIQPVGVRADIGLRQPTQVQWPTELVVRASCGDETTSTASPYHIPIDAASQA